MVGPAGLIPNQYDDWASWQLGCGPGKPPSYFFCFIYFYFSSVFYFGFKLEFEFFFAGLNLGVLLKHIQGMHLHKIIL
jgi:hypothetical protein